MSKNSMKDVGIFNSFISYFYIAHKFVYSIIWKYIIHIILYYENLKIKIKFSLANK